MKKFLASVLAAAAVVSSAFSLASCSSGEPGEKDLENVQSKGTIVVGMECAYAPYNWSQTTASEYTVEVKSGMYADGYDVQVAKKIAEELNVTLVIQPLDWDGLIPALNSNTIDLVIAGMSPTAERKLSIDFSDTYYDSNLVMVIRKDGAYTNATKISDFAGAKITGQLNTFHYSVIDQIAGVNKQTALADFAALTTALKSKAVDGYVCEKPGAVSAVTAYSEFTYIEFAEGDGFTCDPEESSIAVGLRKGSTLTASVNEAIGKISKAQREEMMLAAIARQPVSEN
ncbi:MAG: transporter substrate-binding domain-containing protein [Clostridiales bacterium]|nr:transporter substrate-binding domain-containing protein [Clostridiales bacterium]MDY4895551.1 transporter substrate-binding domain-containing protein [Christensenellaceae bacterium]